MTTPTSADGDDYQVDVSGMESPPDYSSLDLETFYNNRDPGPSIETRDS